MQRCSAVARRPVLLALTAVSPGGSSSPLWQKRCWPHCHRELYAPARTFKELARQFLAKRTCMISVLAHIMYPRRKHTLPLIAI